MVGAALATPSRGFARTTTLFHRPNTASVSELRLRRSSVASARFTLLSRYYMGVETREPGTPSRRPATAFRTRSERTSVIQIGISHTYTTHNTHTPASHQALAIRPNIAQPANDSRSVGCRKWNSGERGRRTNRCQLRNYNTRQLYKKKIVKYIYNCKNFIRLHNT